LAGAVKGQIKVAYWDTEQRGRPPALLGQFQGTPTIRLYKPKRKQKSPKSNAEKTVMDYNQERKAKDMRAFLEYNMPNYAERISFGDNDLSKAVGKADKYGLPKAIFFPSKPKTSSVVKFLSTEFRRRLLFVEIVPTKKNEGVMKEFGLTTEDLPALTVISETGERIKYTGANFKMLKLERFLSEHAKKEPVYKPVVVDDDDGEASKQHVHTEF